MGILTRAVFLSASLSLFPGAALCALAQGSSVTLVAVGDIRLDAAFGRVAAAGGPAAPTAAARRWLAGDILFGNLECALTRRGSAADKKYTFRAPPENAAILREAGFSIVSLGNNHVMDYGPDGLTDTIAALREAGILYAGAGENTEAAAAPVFIEKNGLRFGFLAVTSTLPEENWSGPAKPGVAYSDARTLKDRVRRAKSGCDILVVSYHGGTELEQSPNPIQEEIIGLILGGGADIVLGHHPHVLQPVSAANGKLALFSLGNFLFVSPTPGTEWTAVARLTVSREGIRAEFIPLEIGPGYLRAAGPYGREIVRAALDPSGQALHWDPETAVFRLKD